MGCLAIACTPERLPAPASKYPGLPRIEGNAVGFRRPSAAARGPWLRHAPLGVLPPTSMGSSGASARSNIVWVVILLHADERALLALARRHRITTLRISLVTVPIAVAILFSYYQAMLLAFIVLSAALFSAVAGWRARRQARIHGFLAAEAHPQGILIRSALGEELRSYDENTRLTASSDAVALVFTRDKNWEHLEIPGASDAVVAFVSTVRANGGTVSPRLGPAALIGLLLGVLTAKILGVVAGALALAGMANLILAALDRGGSYGVGLGLLGGALAGLTVAALGKALGDTGSD